CRSPLSGTKSGPLGLQITSEQLPERHFRVNFDDALVFGCDLRYLPNTVPHPEALQAQLRPAAFHANRLGLLVGCGTEDDGWEGREHAGPAHAEKLSRRTLRFPQGEFRKANRYVNRDRDRLRPGRRERRDGRVKTDARIPTIVQSYANPLT